MLLAGTFGWYVLTHLDNISAGAGSPSPTAIAPTDPPGVGGGASPVPEGPDAADYLEAALYITEIMPQNRGTLRDGDGLFSDWIELGNLGDKPIDLGGWYLADKEDLIRDWSFPDTVLAPGEYTVVFASGKNTVREKEIHTSFSLSADETVYLTTPAGDVLRTVDLTDTPEGYSLAMGGDGAFYPIALSTPGYPNTPEGYTCFAQGDVRDSGLLLWEMVPYGGDWVELKNTSGEDIDLSGYYITDSLDKPEKFQPLTGVLASGELTAVTCTAFGLNSVADDLYLCTTDGTVQDWAFLRNISAPGNYGRVDGQTGFFYFTKTTQGSENTSGYRVLGAVPTVDILPGVYDDTESLTVALSGENVRYTTDGSLPTQDSPAYIGPITITKTTVLRAASFPEGLPPTDTGTFCYFLRENSSLPIASLVTDEANLFGSQGIYTSHEIAWQEDWERDANFSFFEEDGSFSIDCGVKIHGRTSRRASEKRSLTLKFRGRYDGDLNYDIFGDGIVTEFSSLILRGSIEDTYSSYLRDVLFADMAMDFTSVPAQNYRFVSLYINGAYWGIYAIREQHNKDYFASHYGVDADTVDMRNGEFRNPGIFTDLLNYAETHNLADPEAWSYIQEHLDVETMIDWLVLECWSGDIDVYENVRFYTSPEYENGRVLYGLTDMDLTMMNHQTYAVGFEGGAEVHYIIPRALLRNEEFMDAFLTRLGSLLQNEMSDANVQARIDALAAIIREETGRDLERWEQRADLFTAQLANLADFTDGRAKEMADSAAVYFGLTPDQRAQYFGTL